MKKRPLTNLPTDAIDVAADHRDPILRLIEAAFPGEAVTTEITKIDQHRRFPSAFLDFKVGEDTALIQFDAETNSDNKWARTPEYKIVGWTAYVNGHRASRAPLKVDGTFSYDRIATALISEIRSARFKRAAAEIKDNRYAANKNFVEAFNKAAQPDLGSIVVRTQVVGPPLEVRISFRASCTGSAAVELAEYLKAWHATYAHE